MGRRQAKIVMAIIFYSVLAWALFVALALTNLDMTIRNFVTEFRYVFFLPVIGFVFTVTIDRIIWAMPSPVHDLTAKFGWVLVAVYDKDDSISDLFWEKVEAYLQRVGREDNREFGRKK